jgi:ABC-type lipoprotein release transport system permease subunit
MLGSSGGLGAIALRGTIAAQLYGIGALDPRVIFGAVTILAITPLLACLGPARRAMRVSPLAALSGQ